MAGTTRPDVVRAESPDVARVVQVGWDHEAGCAVSPGVAWVAHSGCKPSGKGAQKPRLTRQMVRGPQQSWNTRAMARAQKPKPDNAMGWSVGLEVMPD